MYPLLVELFPYLVLFYLLDSLVHVRRSQTLFARGGWGGYGAGAPGLHLVPVGPFADVIVAEESALLVTAAGVYAPRPDVPVDPRDPEGGERDLVPFDDVSRLEVDGRRVRSRGRLLVEAGSPAGARAAARLVEELKAAPAARRLALIRDGFTRSADGEVLRARRKGHAPASVRVNAWSAALFVALFGVLPASLFTSAPWTPRLSHALAAVAVLYAGTVATAFFALRRCGQPPRQALTALSPLFFFPPAAAHAGAVVFRDLYAGCDRLGVAAELLAPAAFRAFARREMRRIAAARERSGEHDRAGFWALREAGARKLLAGAGVDMAALLEPPPRPEPEAARFCPLCAAEYRDGFSTCTDCGVLLEAFAEA